jgi:gamma-glutamyltranspeptidase/glutathione hydrolase
MLPLLGEHPRGDQWTPEAVAHLLRVQHSVPSYRHRKVDPAEEPEGELARLLETAAHGDPAGLLQGAGRGESASTLHVSAVDSEGWACAATFSDGYGSGIVPPGTGIWLNNCLGERELNPRGFHALAPGTRLLSNMTPTVGRTASGGVLAIGSPGSERIPTAVLQALVNHLRLGMDLEEAVAHPRLHVESEGPGGDGERRPPRGAVVHCEPGLPMEAVELPLRRYGERAMFFGGVEAAAWRPGRGFDAAADARRTGGTALEG